MIAVSLFSGCGGMDFGVKAAGFDIPFCNDFDRHACHTLRLNESKHVVEASIEDLEATEVRSQVGSASKTVDLLFGGPPCQPFSKSGYWVRGDTRRLEDPRANTLPEFFRFVEELQPKSFLLENVHGISYNGKEEGFKFILEQIDSINRRTGASYRPAWKVINTADYGVPQTRVRFFMVALRNGKQFRFPPPTHRAFDTSSENLLFDDQMESHVTAWEAIGNVTPSTDEKLTVGGQWAELLPSIPEGENYLWHTDRKGGMPLFGWRTRYWCFLLKLAKNRPSWTLQAQPGSAIGPFHWNSRKLSWREMAALQTFPKDFRIESSRVEIQRQIGNAVPSLMAEILARSIARQLGKKVTDETTLPVLRQAKIPEPEVVKPVPKKYHERIGEHAAHPGTGKGRSYQKKVSSS